ncbi:MerR family transcriptional regulator [Streptomyces sp. CA-294286]|uniref:MerR family transcriptional regulator n=1 Tax=Streptomyces sp. CA-294286 TaxID=3240070 RepID=UPI003D8C9FD4
MSERALRTSDVARVSGYSVQQVRDLERLGVLPPAARSANGYRGYAPVHVRALHAYRGLAHAMGPVDARRLLVELGAGTLADAAAAVGAVHVRLAREREEVLHAQQALRAIGDETGEDPPEHEGDAMTITELAEALGVRTSTLRFWEDERLLAPARVTSLRARRYGPDAVAAARIVVALRGAGHGIPAVRETLRTLRRGGGLDETSRVLRDRLDRIADRSVALLRAGSDLAAVVTHRAAAVHRTVQCAVLPADDAAPPPRS